MVAQEFIEQSYPVTMVLKMIGLPKSSYYYVPTGTVAGKKPSKYVYHKDGYLVGIDQVVEDIKQLLNMEFVDYGYYKTYIYLREHLGYKIGSTRTYNLMKAHKLLKFQRKDRIFSNRTWVKDLVPKPTTEFSFLEFDIKYMYVHGKRTNVQVLTILDVFSRWNLGHFISWRINSNNVIELFEKIFGQYDLPLYFIVRNDNGSQFEAGIVQEYLKSKGVTQEFTKPATPQQNAHIESYHSILESAVCQRIELMDLDHTREVMDRFKDFYNLDRIHSGLDYKSPYKFLLLKGVDMMNKKSANEKIKEFIVSRN